MKIIIAGAGDVGFHLAKLLSRESQDIFLIDRDRNKLDQAAAHTDVFPLRGNCTHIKVLEEAQVASAELLIAVTDSEETNVITALIGKKLGANQTIARVKNLEFLEGGKIDLESMGIDSVISPRELLVNEIKRLVDQRAATDAFDFADGLLKMMGIILHEGSPLIGRSVTSTSDLNPKHDFIPIAIHRNGETVIPRSSSVFQSGDHVYFISKPGGMEQIASLSGDTQRPIKNVMIVGGGLTGLLCARKLRRDYKVKIVEKNMDRSQFLAEELPGCLIVHADARDVESLEEEGLDDIDAFIALTGDSGTNILSCLVAKNHQVGKTISLVENIDYINISQNIGIDALINRKLIAANNIFRYIRKGEISAIAGIHGINAELIEFIAKPGSRITHKPLKDLKFPQKALIGGLIRGKQSFIVSGDFQIEEADHVVVFCLPEAIRATERMFN